MPPETSKTHIAIAGGGIAGLAGAALLTRRGFAVEIFDKAPKPMPVGSGLIMQPSSAAVLEALEIAEEIKDKGQRLERLAGRVRPSGKLVLDIHYQTMGAGVHAIGIQRDILYTALLTQAQKAGATIHYAKEVRAVAPTTQNSDKKIALHFTDGSHAGPFDLLVNALGAQ